MSYLILPSSDLILLLVLLFTMAAQDYSVVIANPPNDATDPAEWKNFFADKFDAHVTVCVSKEFVVLNDYVCMGV